jgi:hypothetical protein
MWRSNTQASNLHVHAGILDEAAFRAAGLISRSPRSPGGFVAEHPVPPVPLFLRPIGNIDDPIMKKLLLAPAAVAALTLAGCGSSGPTRDASQPLVYVTSARTTSDITECLESRLSRVRASSVGSATELAIGSDSNTAYFVTLTPTSAGSEIKVMRPANAPDDPPEPEMRFDIARCAT